MFSLIKNLILTDTGKDAVIVSIGTFINIVAGGLFFILTPRILGPEDYGLFSTVIATGLMAASIANFGIDTGILKFAKLGSSYFNWNHFCPFFGFLFRPTTNYCFIENSFLWKYVYTAYEFLRSIPPGKTPVCQSLYC